jgi:hypothetical protein
LLLQLSLSLNLIQQPLLLLHNFLFRKLIIPRLLSPQLLQLIHLLLLLNPHPGQILLSLSHLRLILCFILRRKSLRLAPLCFKLLGMYLGLGLLALELGSQIGLFFLCSCLHFGSGLGHLDLALGHEGFEIGLCLGCFLFSLGLVGLECGFCVGQVGVVLSFGVEWCWLLLGLRL